LESLKKGEALQKDEDDATLLANTYDPEADPKHPKCNKRRQRQTKGKFLLLYVVFLHFYSVTLNN